MAPRRIARLRVKRYRSYLCDSDRWHEFELRAGDVVVTTPPKCGTTWMQMCCLVLIHGPELPRPLGELAPWLDQTVDSMDDIRARLDAQDHRRVIKTHTPLDGLPEQADVTYVGVGRDPRDVVLSAGDHSANMRIESIVAAKERAGRPVELPNRPPRPDDPSKAIQAWLEAETPLDVPTSSLPFTVHHLRTVWERRHEQNVDLFHYSDLRRDLEGEMRRLAAAIGIDVDESAWPVLLDAASLDAMRAKADVLAPNASHELWRDNRAFFAEGRLGAWRDVFDDDNRARYERRLNALAGDDADFVAWLHR